MPTIHFIYASTTGNTEAVMDKIASMLKEAGYQIEMHRSEETSFDVIRANTYFVLGTSTWGHGTINPFYDNLLVEIKQNSTTGKVAAFVGLGDSQYEDVYFNKGIDLLKEAFIASGGKELYQVLKIDGDPFALLDTKVLYWGEKLITALKDATATQ